MSSSDDAPGETGIEPDTLAFLRSLDTEGPGGRTAEAARARELKMARIDVPKRPVLAEDGTIPGGPNGEIRVRIIRPKATKNSDLPIVMFFHGGGWVAGDKETHDRLARDITHGAEAAVVVVDYTRAPEARYPVAIEEAFAATAWMKKNGRSVGLDSEHLAVVGDSSGGNMAAAVTLLAQERGGPAIDAQVLLCPVTDATFSQRSYAQFPRGFFLTPEGVAWSWDQYAPDRSVRGRATASPLRATHDELAALPPALVVTAEFDVLRDEGEAYAHRLTEAGVKAIATRYLGTIHAFTVLNPLAHTPPSRAAVAQVGQFLRDALL